MNPALLQRKISTGCFRIEDEVAFLTKSGLNAQRDAQMNSVGFFFNNLPVEFSKFVNVLSAIMLLFYMQRVLALYKLS